MTDLRETISKAIILIGFVGVVWVTNVEPMVGRPFGQPALTLRAEPASSLVGSRFDQAQEDGR